MLGRISRARRRLASVVLSLAFVGGIFLSGAATSESGRAASSVTSLTVQSTGRNACSPATLTAAPGAIAITFTNPTDEHQDFGIVGHGTASPEGVRRGESATLSTDLPAGSYTFWCGDDLDKAMRGTLTVAQGSGGGTAATTTGPAGQGAPAPPSNVSVTMQDNSFSPSTIHAAAGQVTVTITNSGHSSHTFTIGTLANQIVAPGQTKTVTFTAAAGTYRFFCVYHGSMVGSLVVEAAAATPAGPPATTTSGTSTAGAQPAAAPKPAKAATAVSCAPRSVGTFRLVGTVEQATRATLVVDVAQASALGRLYRGKLVSVRLSSRTSFVGITDALSTGLQPGARASVTVGSCAAKQRLRVATKVNLLGAAAPAPKGAGSALRLQVDPKTMVAFNHTTLQARAGKVTITLANPTPVEHNIAIEGHGAGKLVGKGGTSTVTAILKRGTYKFLCQVPGHAAAGMRGVLTVR